MATEYDPLPGIVVVRPLDSTIINGIYQVQLTYGAATSIDCGHVLAVGDGVDLSVGDFVAYRPFEGLMLDKRTRFFGRGCPWHDQVVAKVAGTPQYPHLEPTGDWVLIKFQKLETLLLDVPVYYTRGNIIRCGPDVDRTLLGKRAEVRKYLGPQGPQDHMRNLDFARGMAEEAWGLVPASEVIAIYP